MGSEGKEQASLSSPAVFIVGEVATRPCPVWRAANISKTDVFNLQGSFAQNFQLID